MPLAQHAASVTDMILEAFMIGISSSDYMNNEVTLATQLSYVQSLE